MKTLGNLLQSGDWKGEKHVPVITCPDKVKAGERFELKVSIGDAIAHPNTVEHHISWFKIFFHGEGDKFPVEIATFNFTSHGEGNLFTDPVGITELRIEKAGIIYALSYCNIHGLWENTKAIEIE